MNKKKRVTILVCAFFATLCMVSCGQVKEEEFIKNQQKSDINVESFSVNEQESSTQMEENVDSEMTSENLTTSDNSKEDDIEPKDIIEIDFTYDYTEDIKADVNYVVCESSSLQEELNLKN